ncbi:MAG: hypothetical protein LBT03_00095 [Holosporales bacterium]|jgi:hypothetical protein|nr:hypothetical protein [Holosporales bacterium]
MASSVEVLNEFEYDEINNRFIGFLTNITEKEHGKRVLAYCPFCGAKFPERLGDKLTEILQKEYGLGSWKDYKKTPPEFQTDEWWKKRGL